MEKANERNIKVIALLFILFHFMVENKISGREKIVVSSFFLYLTFFDCKLMKNFIFYFRVFLESNLHVMMFTVWDGKGVANVIIFYMLFFLVFQPTEV